MITTPVSKPTRFHIPTVRLEGHVNAEAWSKTRAGRLYDTSEKWRMTADVVGTEGRLLMVYAVDHSQPKIIRRAHKTQ